MASSLAVLRHHTQGTALQFINDPQCMALQYFTSFQRLWSDQGQPSHEVRLELIAVQQI